MRLLAALAAALSLQAITMLPAEAAPAPERIRVALSTKDYGYLPLFVGMRAGFFKEEGLDVHWLAFNPDAAFILKKKGFTELASLADIGAWPWAGYATTDAKLTQERDKIKRWTRAMVKSLQFMVSRRDETIKIAMQEFNHPRDVAEGASAVSVRAIDPRDPGRAS